MALSSDTVTELLIPRHWKRAPQLMNRFKLRRPADAAASTDAVHVVVDAADDDEEEEQ